jgi:hypothetical protein
MPCTYLSRTSQLKKNRAHVSRFPPEDDAALPRPPVLAIAIAIEDALSGDATFSCPKA